MTAQAVELLQDATLQEGLSWNELAWVRQFDWERIAEEFLKAVETGI